MEPALTPRPPADSNGMGVAGFVISLVGLCSGGVLSPIGLILSLIAVGREPRGFAIAGIVLGALGSCGFIVTLLFVPVVIIGVLLAAGAGAMALAVAGVFGSPELNAFVEGRVLEGLVQEYVDDHGALPATLDDAIPQAMRSRLTTDPWDRPYILELAPDGTNWRVYSTGPDGQPGTPDDIGPTYWDSSDSSGTTPSAPQPSDTPAPSDDADEAGSPDDAPM